MSGYRIAHLPELSPPKSPSPKTRPAHAPIQAAHLVIDSHRTHASIWLLLIPVRFGRGDRADVADRRMPSPSSWSLRFAHRGGSWWAHLALHPRLSCWHASSPPTCSPMPTDRRTFLASVRARDRRRSLTESSRGFAANDTLHVGLHRHRRALPAPDEVVPGKMPNVKITAVCDVWDDEPRRGRRSSPTRRRSPPRSYEELLARKDIDAVLIGIARPLARADDRRRLRGRQGRLRREAADARPDRRARRSSTAQNEHKRDRAGRHAAAEHAAHHRRRTSWSRPGTIGKVHKVHCTWNRNADRVPQRSKDGIDPKTVDWKRSSATRRSRRSTSTASATGAGSGTSAAASSPT